MTQILKKDIEALIPSEVIGGIIDGVRTQSKAMQMFRRLPNMKTNQARLRVLDTLPIAYWQSAPTSLKKLTNTAWENKYIVAEELAVIVPISEQLVNDIEYNVWSEVKPLLIEAFAKKFDQTVFSGIDKPFGFREGLITTALNAGMVVTQEEDETLYSTINRAMGKVEESGFEVNGIIGGVGLKSKLRGMVDTIGRPITDTEINDINKAFLNNGAWDKNKAEMIVGDMSQAVYSIRQDITFKILDQAMIQDPATGQVLYNLPQQDMLAIRAVMRIGWEVPNPVNALNEDESTRFPFAVVLPKQPETNYTATINVANKGGTPIENAKVRLGGVVKFTDEGGNAEFIVNNGSEYLYNVNKENYKTEYGELKVESDNQTINVTLKDA